MGMRRGFDGEDLDPEEEPAARELTLGPVALLALISGLALLCCLCFGLGYAAGRRAPVPTIPAKSGETPAQPQTSTLQKPMAAGVVPSVAAPATMADMPQSQGASNGGQNPLTSYAPSGAANEAAAGQPSLVKPALPDAQSGAQQVGGLEVKPALKPSAGLMVQIAAVSHAEDANVLMNALRKR
jgi:DedD protein